MKSRRLPRTTTRHDNRVFVSVTSAMGLVKQLLNEPPDSYGDPALAHIHALEGTACHAICLDWLAHHARWLECMDTPVWPAEHGDQHRWHAVLHAALKGFQEFVAQYDVAPLGIEQEVFSDALGLVGHVDLCCEMTWKKRRIQAVVDLKFVAGLMESHRLQVRCYGKLVKGAQIGLLYHANRNTGLWKLEPVDLTKGLDDVAAVANAARLYLWADAKGRKENR